MEEVLASHPDVAECAVAGVHDPVKGEVPLGFVVLKAGVTKDQDIIRTDSLPSYGKRSARLHLSRQQPL